MIQTALADYDQVISNILINMDEKTISECQASISLIGQYIKESSYSDQVKSSLYSFFINPIPVIQKLSYELMAKELLLSQKYERAFSKVVELQHEFDLNNVSEKLKMCQKESCNIEEFIDIIDIYVSICVLNKNCIKTYYLSDKVLLILGMDYAASLEYCISQNILPELDVFGNALAEKNRVEILELIWRKEEITIKDIEQELGFTGTNAYYHLTLMIKAGMLKTRNQGRTVLYSLNKQYFDVVRDMLSKYAK